MRNRIYNHLKSNISEDDFKKKLKYLKLNKKTFAQKCGISESSVKRWFKNNYLMPKYIEILLDYMIELEKCKNDKEDLKKLKIIFENLKI
ncbi:hypothetical protein ACN09M_09910 [Aliarcobacter butzleri]|uniref:XRE family transcriptional regulator n=1 Tax=Arcobacteraceae TaxID=2808963 RepID=UPI001EE0E616|nr:MULTISPECIES: XRE family transcriptional regulator [Arcobacteraceae]MCG3695470.1 XRE family transcriptional regulator [Aliarcobacter butzleri]MDY3205598.1 XRE family transcriptional regulator [Arcobacter sp.]